MNLRRQLFIVSLLLLSLPWAGCQYIRGIDSTLRFAQEQSLRSTTQAIAAVLAQEPNKLYPNADRLADITAETDILPDDQRSARMENPSELFFQAIDYPILIDGYNDEWPEAGALNTGADETQNTSVRYQTASYGGRLYLYFEVTDNNIIYHNPTISGRNNGDRLVLVTGELTHYILTTSAPGAMKAYYRTGSGRFRRQSLIRATWQESSNGYTIEASIPLKLTGDHLGFYFVNENSQSPTTIFGSLSNEPNVTPAWLVYQPPGLTDKLTIFDQPGTRISVLDRHFWQLAQAGELNQTTQGHGHWLLRKLYRLILKEVHENNLSRNANFNYDDRRELHNALISIPDHKWYNDPDNSTNSVLASAVPIVIDGQVVGAVLAEQSSDRFVAITDDAFNQLLLYSLASLTATGLGLLGYASWLSWRIRRLSQAAQQVLGDDGTLHDTFPHSRARDEIGDLTRSYQTLLHRISDYTLYLQTLSRKLSHELRTPLAIIHSSLDNLEHCTLDKDAQTYQMRAKDGASRLGNILTAMSEATRVEQSIQHAELEQVNLAALLHGVTGAYRDLYAQHNIILRGISTSDLDDPSHVFEAVPDLIVQMLDKLVDNAVDFCPERGEVVFHYTLQDNTGIIEVSNDGPLLPESMQHQLFDNMVSLREDHSDQSHLGLGLHIAQLIVNYHNGKISAANRSDGSGVIFKIVIPKKTGRSR
jgi:two-component system, OmpR family, sensor histidine kinase ChvG